MIQHLLEDFASVSTSRTGRKREIAKVFRGEDFQLQSNTTLFNDTFIHICWNLMQLPAGNEC